MAAGVETLFFYKIIMIIKNNIEKTIEDRFLSFFLTFFPKEWDINCNFDPESYFSDHHDHGEYEDCFGGELLIEIHNQIYKIQLYIPITLSSFNWTWKNKSNDFLDMKIQEGLDEHINYLKKFIF